MALKDIVKVTRKTYFNPRAWLGYDYLKSQTLYLWLFAKLVFGSALVSQHPKTIASFDEAMKQYEVTEEDLATKQKIYGLFALFFVAAGSIVLLIFIKYLIEWRIAAALGSLGVTFLLFCLAFKYDFWRFQIKHRILTCTFADWWHGASGKGK